MDAVAGISVSFAARLGEFLRIIRNNQANKFSFLKKSSRQSIRNAMNELTGQSLQIRRMRLGIRAKDVALRLGISPSYYSEIERGRKPVPSNSEFIRSLSKVFGEAEREAGISSSLDVSLAGAKNDEERASILQGASLGERLASYPVGSAIWALEVQGAAMETDINLSSFIKNTRQLSRLAKLAAKALKSDEKLAAEIHALSKKIDWQANKIEPMAEEFIAALFDLASRIEHDASRNESQ
jgi:transcriptional regulator with XRE-family HTH domain